MVGGWWRLVVGGWWRLAVGGLSTTTIVNKQTSTTPSPDVNSSSAGHQTRQSMFNASRRLSAVQGERRRHILHPFMMVSSPRQPRRALSQGPAKDRHRCYAGSVLGCGNVAEPSPPCPCTTFTALRAYTHIHVHPYKYTRRIRTHVYVYTYSLSTLCIVCRHCAWFVDKHMHIYVYPSIVCRHCA